MIQDYSKSKSVCFKVSYVYMMINGFLIAVSCVIAVLIFHLQFLVYGRFPAREFSLSLITISVQKK